MQLSLLSLSTPEEIGRTLGRRIRELRLLQDWSRGTLAARAGVAPASLKRFENTGRASLDLVLRVALALGRLADFEGLLTPPVVQTLAELERQARNRPRKRGRH